MSLTSGNHHHQSAKMMQAQAYFQQIVKQELQCLLSQAIDRDVAVKQLLHRIVECTETPHEQDIKRVMKQFQMQYDDAVRALIVKQEIGRLKRQGLDAFAAIEELTRKMQGKHIHIPNEGVVEEEKEKKENSRSIVRHEEDDEDEEEDDESSPGGMEDDDDDDGDEAIQNISPLHHLSSLSLCQQIDQVTISTLPTVLSTNIESERVSPPPPPPSPSHSSSPQSKETTSVRNRVNHSKKRRASLSPTQSLPPILRRKGKATKSGSTTRTSRIQRHHVNKPRSPTFECPKLKKQKIWNELTRKTPLLLDSPSSPTTINSNETIVTVENESLEVTRKCRTLKRPSPHLSLIPFEEEDDDSMITKRHKTNH